MWHILLDWITNGLAEWNGACDGRQQCIDFPFAVLFVKRRSHQIEQHGHRSTGNLQSLFFAQRVAVFAVEA